MGFREDFILMVELQLAGREGICDLEVGHGQEGAHRFLGGALGQGHHHGSAPVESQMNNVGVRGQCQLPEINFPLPPPLPSTFCYRGFWIPGH